jgi:hypothetical protein
MSHLILHHTNFLTTIELPLISWEIYMWKTHGKDTAISWEVSTLEHIDEVAETSLQHFDGNKMMSRLITIGGSFAKCQTIIFITNSSDAMWGKLHFIILLPVKVSLNTPLVITKHTMLKPFENISLRLQKNLHNNMFMVPTTKTMSPAITLWGSLTKCQTITLIINSRD